MATVRQPPAAEFASSTPVTPWQSSSGLVAPDLEGRRRNVQVNRPNEEVSLIRKAWEFCVQHHEGQMRASGEPYIVHPLEVAEVLAEMKLDATAIADALLHDAVEDTPATREE